MIVVVGIPAWRPPATAHDRGAATGPAVEIARAAVAAGGRVELVGKAGEDPEADALLIELTRSGIGHVALLRDPALPTRVIVPPSVAEEPEDVLDTNVAALVARDPEPAVAAPPHGRSGRPARLAGSLVLEPADLELALRYLVEFRVLVIAEEVAQTAARVAVDAAAFAGAQLVAVATPASASELPADASVFEPPEEDPDAEFARLVGGYAAALDRGELAEVAFRSAVAAQGWEPAG